MFDEYDVLTSDISGANCLDVVIRGAAALGRLVDGIW